MTVTIGTATENEILKWICKGQAINPQADYVELLDSLGNKIIPSTYPLTGRQDAGRTGVEVPPIKLTREVTFQGMPACTVSTVVLYNYFGVECMRFPISPGITVTAGTNLYMNTLGVGYGYTPNQIEITVSGSTGVTSATIGLKQVEKGFNGSMSPGSVSEDNAARYITVYDGSTDVGTSAPFTTATWVSATSGGGMVNSNRVIFNDMPACTVSHWMLYSATETYFKAPLASPVSVSAGQKFVFEPGDLRVRVVGV